MNSPNQLYLVLTKQWFTEILEGRKKEEYRDFTDYYINRLCVLNEEGEIINTKNYKTVRFQLGYQKSAPQMVVEVKDILIEMDENIDIDKGDLLTTDNSNFTIILGEILEKTNC